MMIVAIAVPDDFLLPPELDLLNMPAMREIPIAMGMVRLGNPRNGTINQPHKIVSTHPLMIEVIAISATPPTSSPRAANASLLSVSIAFAFRSVVIPGYYGFYLAWTKPPIKIGFIERGRI
jgi:hypothetical protein